MEIGVPTNIRHVTHVIFDRLQGFLGLPIEFELEVPRRVPSASASAFGVSAESMQCSFDAHGNSVPTILLLLQERLYKQGGLKTEGIFRINPDNSKEEQLREQMNKGVVPHDIDPHCLAGLIKAWFRELPKGVLDSLSPEQVMQCHTEDRCLALVKALPSTQSALLDWAVSLMADVVQEEANNKMNARNVAVVFAPNMTQMLDPLMALKHAVQVMNLLKTLILKTLRDRERSVIPTSLSSCTESLARAKKEPHDSTITVQASDMHASKGETATFKASTEDTLKSGGVLIKSNEKDTQRSTKALTTTEIVEQIGSASDSDWSSSTYSSRRDEDDHALDDQGRSSDQLLWHYDFGDGTVSNPHKDKFGQSQPLGYWLCKGQLPTALSKRVQEHVLTNKGSRLDGLRTVRNVSPTQSKDGHSVSQNQIESSWASHKPLVDWLHCERSPAITFGLLKEAAMLEQDEKLDIKSAVVEKPACLDYHTRVAHPLSKRTLPSKNFGFV
ncbi:hypothetical protein L7F22_066708 [Adiantum nelumboides]|nr:hypothetical protein [Adiantum nelumboides]